MYVVGCIVGEGTCGGKGLPACFYVGMQDLPCGTTQQRALQKRRCVVAFQEGLCGLCGLYVMRALVFSLRRAFGLFAVHDRVRHTR